MSTNKEKYDRARATLVEYLASPITEARDVAGILQGFGFTFELAWRCVQDVISAAGYQERGPRPSLQAGLRHGLISVDDAEIFAEMVEARNLVAHTYRPEWAIQLVSRIKDEYLPALDRLAEKL